MVVLAVLLSVLTAGATLAGRLGNAFWIFDLASHWPVHLALGTLLPLGMLLACKKQLLALIPAGVIAFNLWLIAPLYWSRPHVPAQQPTLRAMAANVHTANQQTHLLLDLVRKEAPDILVLMEIDHAWEIAIEALHADYPYRIVHPRRDNFGIALLSRYPLLSERIERLTTPGVPTIFATLDIHARPLHVIATHPVPPIGGEYTALRNEQLHALAGEAARLDGSVMLLGDLNTTSSSPVFADLLRASGLRDSRRGFGIQPTWPQGAWYCASRSITFWSRPTSR